MKLIIKSLFVLGLITMSACQVLPERKDEPADVRDATIDAKINPKDQQESVLETVPLMNNAILTLYNNANELYKANQFNQAIASLERAYEIQPNVGKITQLLAEIQLHKGDFKQAHYWATIATNNGPAKGSSCEKSWRILAVTSEKLGYVSQQTQALESQHNCLVKAQNRY